MAITVNRQSNRVIYASRSGVPLDGTTDAAPALQALLNRAANGPLHLIIDGVALIGGTLRLYSNTTVEFLAGSGLIAKAGLGGPIFENAHPRGAAVNAGPSSPQHGYVGGSPTDTNIRLIGPGTLNGNRAGGASGGQGVSFAVSPGANPDGRNSKGEFVPTVRITGCTQLRIGDGLTILDSCTYALQITNIQHFTITGLTVRNNPTTTTNTDGIHLNGPCSFGSIYANDLTTGDDAVALNADDGHMSYFPGVYPPYVTWGPITDVAISDIKLNNCSSAIRILSSISAIDRVTLRGFRGTVSYRPIVIDTDGGEDTNGGGSGGGAVGSILIDDFQVEPTPGTNFQELAGRLNCVARQIVIRGWVMGEPASGPLIQVQGKGNIGLLRLENCSMSDAGGAVNSPWLDVVGGSINRLEVDGLAWARPGQTSASPTPAIRVSGGNVGSIAFSRTSADHLGSIFALTSGSVGSLTSAGLDHTNAGTGASFSLGSAIPRFRASCSNTAQLLSGTAPTSKKTDATEDQ